MQSLPLSREWKVGHEEKMAVQMKTLLATLILMMVKMETHCQAKLTGIVAVAMVETQLLGVVNQELLENPVNS